MKHLICCVAAAALLGSGSASAAGPAKARILLASDSTVAEYGPSKYPQMGWGMVLKCSLDPDVEVINLARGGRSTKTFISEGLWQGLLDQLKRGDTVLIQFGHNDVDTTKMERHTDPTTDFPANLTRFVGDVRAKGGQPVLVTPIALHKFQNGKIVDHHGPYAQAIREVAAKTKAPLIDLDADSLAALQARGELAAKNFFLIYGPGEWPQYPQGSNDTTHLNEEGARLSAALVGVRLKGLKLPISAHVKPASTTNIPVYGAPVCSAPAPK